MKELETEAAAYLGAKHAIGVSSGTEALVLALRTIAIRLKGSEYFDQEDEIITTPFTFTATGDAILRSGATPVFADVEPGTGNISAEKIMEYLDKDGSRVKGIIPVHLYGRPCDMSLIMGLARERGLFVIEDVAQAFGAGWNGTKLGAIGDAGAFSFFPSKNLGGFGDGGMIAVNDDETDGLVRMLLKHGGRDKYNVDHIGYNARLDTIQAAVILAKLKYIDELNGMRRGIALKYEEGLRDLHGLSLPAFPSNGEFHVYHQYTVRVKDGKRDELKRFLAGAGVSTMVYYPVPLHKMRVFEGRCRMAGTLAESEGIVEEVLSLPIEPLMKEDDVDYVIENIREFHEE